MSFGKRDRQGPARPIEIDIVTSHQHVGPRYFSLLAILHPRAACLPKPKYCPAVIETSCSLR